MNRILDIVLLVAGELTNDGTSVLIDHAGSIDQSFIVRLNSLYPSGTKVGRAEIERALLDPIFDTGLLAEAVRQPDENAGKFAPLDLSALRHVFDICNPQSPNYDIDIHRELYRDHPHFFGVDRLPPPQVGDDESYFARDSN